MEDIIDIIVTETTNLIEITSQPTDEIIDVNIIDNREDVTLNVTPTVVEININSLTGNFGVAWGEITGTLASQTDLNTALGLKADLVGGKVPSSQLPSYVDDIVEVANYAALPATGETGKIYVVLDTNKIYRWSGSAYIEIADSTAVWGAITGTLSSQTDLQTALNAKVPYTGATGNVNLGEYGATVGYLGFDTTPTSTPTGIGSTYWDSFYRTLSLIDGDGDTTLQIGQEQRVLVHNNTGSTLTDGQVVYVIGSTGELPSVALASNASESTSSVTFGIVTESIAHGANGFITTSGIIHGLNTNAYDEGAAIYLGSTAGTFTQTKPIAPANSVLVGYIIKKSGGNGSIFVKIQNGYELEELHDVLITSKTNNDGLFYESSTSLWKNKSIATVLGYTPANGANYLPLAGGTMTGAIVGTTATFTNSSGIGLGVTQSGPTGDGIKITHSAGRAFNIQSSGGGFGILINNETASTSIPFTIQKQGLGVITFTDAGDGVFASSVTANSFIKTSGTSSQFLKADGSVDSSVYLTTSSAASTYLALGGGTMTGALIATSAAFSGYVGMGNTSPLYPLDVTGAGRFSGQLRLDSTITNGTYTYTLPSATGTLALTSNLSSYLPLSGGTLTGALSGTSASFSASSAAVSISNASDVWYNVTRGSSITNIGIDSTGSFYNTNTNHRFLTNSGSTTALTIASTGAATFSSSVTATSALLNRTASVPGVYKLVVNTGTNVNVGFGIQDGVASIESFNDAVNAGTPLRIYGSSIALLNGNVGIGTTSPTTFSGYTVLSINNATQGGILELQSNTTSALRMACSTSDSALWEPRAVPVLFATSNTERMRITSGGNVGIGTTVISQNFGGYTHLDIGNATTGGILLFSNAGGTNYGYINGEAGGLNMRATVGNLTFNTGATERMRIVNSGALLYGTTSGGQPNISALQYFGGGNTGSYEGVLRLLHSSSNVSGSGFIDFWYNGNNIGSISQNGTTATSYNTTSDYRLKEDLKPINGLELVNKIKVYDYKWKASGDRMDGVLAHELAEVLPYAVTGVKDGERMQGVDYSKIVPVMIQAIQELKAELDTLKNK